jgi:cyclopropane fatty-acyl-phospholipid synthase-like methyltransferase
MKGRDVGIFGRVDPRSLLRWPGAYNLHSRIAASDRRKRSFVDAILQVPSGARVLDIGCGTAPLLRYMPSVDYVGFDLSAAYIERARRDYGEGPQFHHQALTIDVAAEQAPFDIVMALGVIHHLDATEAKILFEVAFAALKPGGRLITCDGAFTEPQNPLARILLKMDRGKHVRKPDQYKALADSVFPQVSVRVYHNLNAYPYTHCVITALRTAPTSNPVERGLA